MLKNKSTIQFKNYYERSLSTKLKIDSNFGISTRNSVVYVLRNVFKGIKFILENTKTFNHL